MMDKLGERKRMRATLDWNAYNSLLGRISRANPFHVPTQVTVHAPSSRRGGCLAARWAFIAWVM